MLNIMRDAHVVRDRASATLTDIESAARGRAMLRICLVMFVLILCRIPAVAQTYSEMESERKYGLSAQYQIEKFKKYPLGAKTRHEIGQAVIKFTIDSTGRLLDSEITKPSCFNELNQAALAAVRQAQPFSPFPPE